MLFPTFWLLPLAYAFDEIFWLLPLAYALNIAFDEICGANGGLPPGRATRPGSPGTSVP